MPIMTLAYYTSVVAMRVLGCQIATYKTNLIT